MSETTKFTCKICNKSYTSYNSLRVHSSKLHKIISKTLYTETFCNGVEPTCQCGCGGPVKFRSGGFSKYMPGHQARVHNNWGHNPKALAKSIETMKEKRKNGEVTAWNKGMKGEEYIKHFDNEDGTNSLIDNTKNPERNAKISKALSGRKHSKEHTENHKKSVKKYWDNEENRDAARKRTLKSMKHRKRLETSKLEKLFENILMALEINYEVQFPAYDINAFYDFYLKDYNILIEIDGDYWHCNPNTQHKNPIYEAQIKNVKNDKKKDKWAKDNNITLIRFWEYDINNNLDDVIKKLQEIKSKK